ncbi:MAG: hypothetical protein WD042_02355 [Phycisphaeraceae bacterium]
MQPHPRLYLRPSHIDRLSTLVDGPLLAAASQAVVNLADQFLDDATIEVAPGSHNAHLIRARINQTRVLTLLVRYRQTGDRRYRDAALADVTRMGAWSHWSWIAWRKGQDEPQAQFDLSYGENAATLALAFDWLAAELTDAQRDELLAIARRWVVPVFLYHSDPQHPATQWFARADSNWNTVCAGGAGLVALAMHEHLPEADLMLQRVEQSIAPYFALLDDTQGAWPEGIGYWNYGMRYGLMYLLSHEAATGQAHPVFGRPGIRQTLRFPLEFCPHGRPCSFGDVNRFEPLPFHYALAMRLDEPALIPLLDELPRGDYAHQHWPNAAELLLLHPRHLMTTGAAPAPVAPFVRHYRGQDWVVLADRWPRPEMYLAIRGGTTEGPHAQLDLLSFQCAVCDELLLLNVPNLEYLDTTFSSRRGSLYEVRPDSKNTLLINGVGIERPARVTTQTLTVGRCPAVRLEGAAAFGKMRDGPVAEVATRLFVLLSARAVLIVDHVVVPHAGRVETRLHTPAAVKLQRAAATLTGQRQILHVRFAASIPAQADLAIDAPTSPDVPYTMLRWRSKDLHHAMTMATLLSRDADASVTLQVADDGAGQTMCAVHAGGQSWMMPLPV